MQRCGSCKFWGSASQFATGVDRAGGLRVCTKIDCFGGAGIAEVDSDEQSHPWLATEADFGCVLHEPVIEITIEPPAPESEVSFCRHCGTTTDGSPVCNDPLCQDADIG